jgi:hypothetical protein
MHKNLIDIIDTTNEPNIIEDIMGHRQDMTPEQRLKFDIQNYQRKLASNKGSNFEYWNDKHEKMLGNGWELFLIPYKRKGIEIYKTYATSSEDHAKDFVEQLRQEGNYARIVCGYEKTRQRIKMYSVIYKHKP